MKTIRLAIALLISLLLLSACGGRTAVIFDNQTVCSSIRVELTNDQTGITEVYDVAAGETLTVDVQPNSSYTYYINYSAGSTIGAGNRCSGEYRGQVTVPPGASQHFNLTVATPTPSPQ